MSANTYFDENELTDALLVRDFRNINVCKEKPFDTLKHDMNFYLRNNVDQLLAKNNISNIFTVFKEKYEYYGDSCVIDDVQYYHGFGILVDKVYLTVHIGFFNRGLKEGAARKIDFLHRLEYNGQWSGGIKNGVSQICIAGKK